MGKVLLTLFYHPSERHASDVSEILRRESLNRSIVPYVHSSNNAVSPDEYLGRVASQQGCDHIVTIHSDHKLGNMEYLVFVFSPDTGLYEDGLKNLEQRFNGAYGFDKPFTKPVQLDIELSEYNDPKTSIGIVKELTAFLSDL